MAPTDKDHEEESECSKSRVVFLKATAIRLSGQRNYVLGIVWQSVLGCFKMNSKQRHCSRSHYLQGSFSPRDWEVGDKHEWIKCHQTPERDCGVGEADEIISLGFRVLMLLHWLAVILGINLKRSTSASRAVNPTHNRLDFSSMVAPDFVAVSDSTSHSLSEKRAHLTSTAVARG